MSIFQLGKFSAVVQKSGLDVWLNNFYSPIPNLKELKNRPEIWKKQQSLLGLELNSANQRKLLQNTINPYAKELRKLIDTNNSNHYRWDNHAFGPASAFTLYGFIRHFKSKQIIEVGSGYSTAVSALAATQNRRQGVNTKLTAIEPFPNSWLKSVGGVNKLLVEKVQDIKPALFERLEKNDLLFIDSSHVAKIGSDVNYLYLEILPRLKPGVIVHVHDIFFPYQYPKKWVLESGRFWNEQYLLQAFLAFNNQFEVLWCGSWMHAEELALLQKTLPRIDAVNEQENYFSSSFYFRRRV